VFGVGWRDLVGGKHRVTLDRKVTLGAIALSAVYAALVMAVASPVSFYTLDDPYIHMALAENIARGHFGVNLGEVSNPSSSILWPWLLATFERIGMMLWAPALVNIACFVLTLRIMLAFCMARLAPLGDGATNVLILVGLAALAFNLFGVIFTGMEHSLHVLLSVVAVTRAIDGKYDRVTLAALAIAPLVRFEAAIILAFGVGAALADRRWMFAASAVLAAALPLALYGWWLSGLGLPILPSSVLSKSAASSGLVDGGGGMIGSLVENLVRNAQSAAAPLFAILAVGLVYAALKRAARDRLIALGLIAVLVLVALLGRMDSYARYEVYALCVLGLGLVHLLQAELRQLLTSRMRALILGVGLCLLGASLGPYVFATTPQGARNIDRQQRQMHRLVTECWRMPVAVNDLGWVSFRNDHYVLDLWGLGSEIARKARLSGEPGWMKALADANAVDLAMIYPQWFEGELPAEWLKLGEIGFTDRHVTTYAPMTTVYATRPGAESGIRECLRRISDSAPEGVQVTILR
jgi:hypothetical protein